MESLTGLRSCDPCAPNTLQPLAGQTSCVECPAAGVDCTVQSAVEVLEGWYRPDANASGAANDTALLAPVRCPQRGGCLGGPDAGDSSCAEGHTGPLCGMCKPGYYRSQLRSGGGCALCDDAAAPSIILYGSGGGLALLAAFLYMRNAFKEAGRGHRASTAGAKAAKGPSISRMLSAKLMHGTRAAAPLSKLSNLFTQIKSRSFHLGTLAKILLALFQVMDAFRQIPLVRWPSAYARYASRALCGPSPAHLDPLHF